MPGWSFSEVAKAAIKWSLVLRRVHEGTSLGRSVVRVLKDKSIQVTKIKEEELMGLWFGLLSRKVLGCEHTVGSE